MNVLRPLSDDEYASWASACIPAYAREKVASGVWIEADALEKSQAEHQTLLPDGNATRDNFLYAILDRTGARVGMLWYAVKDRGPSRIAYVYNIEIEAEQRRRGHAKRALQALEAHVRDRGLAGIALHVFGHNTSAQALYVQLGYLPTNINMYKAVDGPGV